MTSWVSPSLAALVAARGVIFWPAAKTTSPVSPLTMSNDRLLPAPILGYVRDRPAIGPRT
jgi:hypothetical protein